MGGFLFFWGGGEEGVRGGGEKGEGRRENRMGRGWGEREGKGGTY